MIPIDVVVEGKAIFVTFLVVGTLFFAAVLFWFTMKVKEIEPKDEEDEKHP